MAMGNEIVLTPSRGVRVEGIVSGTPKPGTVMQIQAGTSPVTGRFTWEAYNRAADAYRPQGPIAILDMDAEQGKLATDAYVSGTRGFLFIPWPGCELNCLLKDITGTGTGDEATVGINLTVDDGTGKLIKTAGSTEAPATLQVEPFIALEAEADVAADALIHVMFTGY